jgi:hypothetical protein
MELRRDKKRFKDESYLNQLESNVEDYVLSVQGISEGLEEGDTGLIEATEAYLDSHYSLDSPRIVRPIKRLTPTLKKAVQYLESMIRDGALLLGDIEWEDNILSMDRVYLMAIPIDYLKRLREGAVESMVFDRMERAWDGGYQTKATIKWGDRLIEHGLLPEDFWNNWEFSPEDWR